MLIWRMRQIMTSETTYYEGECKSTDTKPTGAHIANGSKLLEMDTSILYIYDAESREWRAWK